MKRGSLSNVNSMGDCDQATQSERRRSFPVRAFDLVTMVSLRDLQPLWKKDNSQTRRMEDIHQGEYIT